MARKGENIYKRKDGRWEARYIAAYDANGKAKYKSLYARTYSAAKGKLSRAKTQPLLIADKGKSENGRKYKFWLDEWVRQKRIEVRESTYIRYVNIIKNHISPQLGEYTAEKISTSMIEGFISQKLQSGRLDGTGGLSAKSVSDILAIIKGSLKFAGSYGAAVICSPDRITLKKGAREMRVLSVPEEGRLISVLFKDFDRYKLGVFICLYTGLRIGEICALQWKNVSLGERTVKVEQTMQRIQNIGCGSAKKTRIIISSPKSYAGIRTIPLPDFMVEALRPFAGPADSYVLSGECQSIVEPRTMQNKFKSYLTEGHINDANFHSLRHTFATRCIEAGFDAKTLSEILGHSSVKITLDKYVHSSLRLKRENMEKLTPSHILGHIFPPSEKWSDNGAIQ